MKLIETYRIYPGTCESHELEEINNKLVRAEQVTMFKKDKYVEIVALIDCDDEEYRKRRNL